MPAEHGSVAPGGLRREHIVAAALVASVTIVLGFASGLGVRDAGAAVIAPGNPGGPAAMQPGQPAAPPQAGPAQAGAARPSGTQVGVRPGTPATSGAGGHSGSATGADSGGSPSAPNFPSLPPGSVARPSPPPAGPAESGPQCPPGALDQLLALVAQVLGGVAPAQALSDAGATVPAPAQPDAAQPAPGPLVLPLLDVAVLLPAGDRTVLVVGLIPLLDTVSQREAANRQAAAQQAASSANPLAPVTSSSPPAVVDPATIPGGQLGQLAALLAPVGLSADPGTGVVDPLLAPILGSLGCGGILSATPPGAVQ